MIRASRGGIDMRMQLSDEQTQQVLDALLGADEILSTLYLHGTAGLHERSSASRVADVFHNVQQALSLVRPEP